MYVWNAIASIIKLVDVCAVHELAVAFSHIYLLYTAKLVSWPNLRRIHELPVVVTTANLQIIVVDVRLFLFVCVIETDFVELNVLRQQMSTRISLIWNHNIVQYRSIANCWSELITGIAIKQYYSAFTNEIESQNTLHVAYKLWLSNTQPHLLRSNVSP